MADEVIKPTALPCPFCGVKAGVVNAPYGRRVYCRHDHSCLLRAQVVYDFQLSEWNRRSEHDSSVADSPVTHNPQEDAFYEKAEAAVSERGKL